MVARSAVARLMRGLGAPWRRAPQTESYDDRGGGGQPAAGSDRAALQRRRANRLWVADLTYVPTWSGLVYVACTTDPEPAEVSTPACL